MNLPTDSQRDVLIGTVIDGRYEITNVLSTTPQAMVYVAKQVALDRQVVLKVFREKENSKIHNGDVFGREARALGRLRHRNIITLYDHGVMPDGQLFLVLEHIVGEPLSSRIERGVLPVSEALSIAIEVGTALEETHRLGIVHRDVDSTNVILETQHGSQNVRLIDYGIASSHFETNRAGTETDAYGPPEVNDGQAMDARTDLYGLGVTLLEMLSGRVAHSGLSKDEIGRWVFGDTNAYEDLTDRLSSLLTALLQERLANRPSSATLVLSQLRMLATDFKEVPPLPWPESPTPAVLHESLAAHDPPASDHQRALESSPKKAQTVPSSPNPVSWLPRWRYIILLGLISAAGIGLVRIEKLSGLPMGHSRQIPSVKPTGPETILVESFVHLEERHTGLIQGEIHPRAWIASAYPWAAPRLPVHMGDFGLSGTNPQKNVAERGDGPKGPDGKLAKAASMWVEANREESKRPNYGAAVPLLEAVVNSPGQTMEQSVAEFYLAHALRLNGQERAASRHWERIISADLNSQLTALSRLNLVSTLLKTRNGLRAVSHLDLLENHDAPNIRWAARFLRPYLALVDRRYEAALDEGFTFVETISADSDAPRILLSRMLEMVVICSAHIEGGVPSVHSFLRGLGGREYVRYFLPLQAKALWQTKRWRMAGKIYQAAAEHAKETMPAHRWRWLLKAAGAYVAAGDLDAAKPLMPTLLVWCRTRKPESKAQATCAALEVAVRAGPLPDLGVAPRDAASESDTQRSADAP